LIDLGALLGIVGLWTAALRREELTARRPGRLAVIACLLAGIVAEIRFFVPLGIKPWSNSYEAALVLLYAGPFVVAVGQTTSLTLAEIRSHAKAGTQTVS
jgi:hypothetical protein